MLLCITLFYVLCVRTCTCVRVHELYVRIMMHVLYSYTRTFLYAYYICIYKCILICVSLIFVVVYVYESCVCMYMYMYIYESRQNTEVLLFAAFLSFILFLLSCFDSLFSSLQLFCFVFRPFLVGMQRSAS